MGILRLMTPNIFEALPEANGCQPDKLKITSGKSSMSQRFVPALLPYDSSQIRAVITGVCPICFHSAAYPPSAVSDPRVVFTSTAWEATATITDQFCPDYTLSVPPNARWLRISEVSVWSEKCQFWKVCT